MRVEARDVVHEGERLQRARPVVEELLDSERGLSRVQVLPPVHPVDRVPLRLVVGGEDEEGAGSSSAISREIHTRSFMLEPPGVARSSALPQSSAEELVARARPTCAQPRARVAVAARVVVHLRIGVGVGVVSASVSVSMSESVSVSEYRSRYRCRNRNRRRCRHRRSRTRTRRGRSRRRPGARSPRQVGSTVCIGGMYSGARSGEGNAWSPVTAVAELPAFTRRSSRSGTDPAPRPRRRRRTRDRSR